MNRSILLIGGSGFIGNHIAKKALRLKYNVSSLSLTIPAREKKLAKVKYLSCDITDKKKLEKLLKKKNYNYVINLGGHINHYEKKKTFESHYHGCKNLAEIFLKKKIDLFIQIGSSVEYGSLKSPQKETGKPKKTKSTYGKAKLKATQFLLSINKKHNFPVAIIRPYLVYGPGQKNNRFIPYVITNCLQNKDFDSSSGKQLRDFIFISDFVSLIFKIITNKRKCIGNIFNVGSGKPIKIIDVLKKIKKIIKKGKPNIGTLKMRKDETINLFPSILKTKKYFNWYPKVPFSKGIKVTIKYYKKFMI